MLTDPYLKMEQILTFGLICLFYFQVRRIQLKYHFLRVCERLKDS